MIDLLQLFLTHLQGYKRQAVWSPILIVVEVICELLLPLVMAEIVDTAIPAGDETYIFQLGAVMLVLAGVAISGMFGAGIDAVLTVFPDSLIGYSDFRIGGLANLSMGKVAPAAWVILLCLGAALALANEMDVLALGADTARSLGLRVRGVRVALLALAAALAGAAVSFAGLLGFVGLVAPHMVRRLVGGESRRLLAGCALGGAALLTVCDVAARTLFAPYELPVGVVLSLAGGPFFLWLLFRKGRGHP